MIPIKPFFLIGSCFSENQQVFQVKTLDIFVKFILQQIKWRGLTASLQRYFDSFSFLGGILFHLTISQWALLLLLPPYFFFFFLPFRFSLGALGSTSSRQLLSALYELSLYTLYLSSSRAYFFNDAKFLFSLLNSLI